LSLADFTATFEALLSNAPDYIPQLVSAVGQEGMRDILDHVRKALAEQALARSSGNKTGAARLLGVTRQAVQQLISDLGLTGV
jgi:DNA-binding NtrC family response regulator